MAPKLPTSLVKDPRWRDRLTHSSFFFGALLFHLILFLMVATWVVFKPFIPPSDDFVKTYVPSGTPPPPPPPVATPSLPVPTKSVVTPTTTIISSTSPVPTFSVPLPDLNPATTPDSVATKMTTPTPKTPNNLSARLPSIKSTVTGWGRSADNIRNSNGDPHNVVAKFPVYLASYADGDWGCNVSLHDGDVTAGSLPDLVAKINEWSRGNIKGEVEPKPLDIGGPELLTKNPPFVFFTGHKDFVLTSQEISNLQKYLQNGGAIWGDNALPGAGSRFDVAFRREMKRVIPDKDKDFEPLPLTHDIFTKSWFNITKIPEGMNFYAEPLEHIDIDGKLAVVYTPNDYGDLFFLRILPGDKTTEGWVAPKTSPLFSSGTFLQNKNIFFRNFTLESSLAAHQLGMNIVGFMLVRFDKDLLLTP